MARVDWERHSIPSTGRDAWRGTHRRARTRSKNAPWPVARRFADLLVKRFGPNPDQTPGYCGHPEIELALVRLYRLTNEPSYLELSRFFINQRGQEPNFFDLEAAARLDSEPFRPNHPGSPYAYMQAHKPI